MSKALSSIDLVLAPSRFMADRLKGFLGIEAKVLPNFTSAPEIGPMGPGDHFSFVGVLERNKGLDLLLEAFQSENVGHRLHVMGRGSLEPSVREAERATSGRISYKGFLEGEALGREMASSIALISPSTGNENSPLACIESLALGVPLIVSPRGGLPELVDDPECGIVVGLDPGSISKGLDLISQPDTRERLGKNAFIRYRTNHQPGIYVEKYLRMCEEVAP